MTVLVSLDRDRGLWHVQEHEDDPGDLVETVALEDVDFCLSPKRLAARIRHPKSAAAIGFARGILSDHDGTTCTRRVRFVQPVPPAPIDLDDPPRFEVDGERLREAARFYGGRGLVGWVE